MDTTEPLPTTTNTTIIHTKATNQVIIAPIIPQDLITTIAAGGVLQAITVRPATTLIVIIITNLTPRGATVTTITTGIKVFAHQQHLL